MTTIQKIIAAVLALAAFIGIVYKVDGRWARTERLMFVEMRLEQKIQQDRYWWLKERLEKLQKAFPENRPAPQVIREEKGNLEREIKEIEKPKDGK